MTEWNMIKGDFVLERFMWCGLAAEANGADMSVEQVLEAEAKDIKEGN